MYIVATFDGKGERSFGNDYARNIIIFEVCNSSSSHADQLQEIDLGLMEALVHQKKKFSINFSKADTEFPRFYKNVNFPTQICLGSISNGFSAHEFREVSLNGNVHDFLVD